MEPGMAIQIKEFSLMSTAGVPIKDQDLGSTVLGLDVDALRLRVTIRTLGVDDADLPKSLSVMVKAVEPKGRESVGGRNEKSSMTGPFTATLSRFIDNATFQGDVAFKDLAPFMVAGDVRKEVATVVRSGADANSDKEFVRPLRNADWSQRGAAVQARAIPANSSDMGIDRPDALTLFRAGGVEILELAVVAQPGQDLAAPLPRIRALVRSPADILFYSGHGSWETGNLLIDTGKRYLDWLAPSTIAVEWAKRTNNLQLSPMDLDVLIINGCSVLFWNHKNEPLHNPKWHSTGLYWAQLLCKEGKGPLFAILGYRFSAPLDAAGGNRIAKEMGEAAKELGPQWWKYARRWMDINRKYDNTLTAAAFDTDNGYYYLNLDTLPGSDPPVPCPGYEPGVAKKEIITVPIPKAFWKSLS
jgi:hypothetical protein